MRRFADRLVAGDELAARMPAVDLVLGLPRGGVLVAARVARRSGSPLDVLTVRKLRVPGQPELAFGAVATGAVRVLNQDVIRGAGLPADFVETTVHAELVILAERERRYRGNRSAPVLSGRAVAVVDDGVATGATLRAALEAARAAGAARVVAAAPVMSASGARIAAEVADEVVAVAEPHPFGAVGAHYDDFDEVTDEQVLATLVAARSAGE